MGATWVLPGRFPGAQLCGIDLSALTWGSSLTEVIAGAVEAGFFGVGQVGAGGLGSLMGGGRQDAGAGVGRQNDAGVAELVLDALEVDTGGVGEAGRAVARGGGPGEVRRR